MDPYPDNHYQQQQRQQWPSHLLPQQPSDYSHYYQQDRPPSASTTTALSLNLSSLTVASPTNLSPINPPSSALSPVTPISPSTNPFQQQHFHDHFQFDSSASSSSPSHYDSQQPPSPLVSQLPPLSSSSSATYDSMGSGNAGNGSPVDGSGSTSGAEDSLGMLGMGGSMNILGKPLATNNFVTKLYQMINDPKSTQFIAWTELGTSFVVSNVGEFSRSILGSHFKHNNFSSFVRQLNMYGFHKINRTARAQRTSTDAQTWEFSHHKFLRGRPDLLDEIKRKALEPDPGIKHRVELPGEVAAQLGAMRDENRRMWDQLTNEKRKVEKLVNVVGRLWDVVGKGFPGSVPPFPADLLETAESPNIYITSPTTTISSSTRFPPPPPLSMNFMHSMNSPNSSPTTSDFPGGHYRHHQQQQHVHHGMFDDGSCDPPPPSGRSSAKRQRLDDRNGINDVISGGIGGMVDGGGGGGGSGGGQRNADGDIGGMGRPRSGSGMVPRIGNGDGGGMGRPRSGSGMVSRIGMAGMNGNGEMGMGRPRSGSEMVPRIGMSGGSEMVPRIGMSGGRSGNASTPLLSITTVEGGMGSHVR